MNIPYQYLESLHIVNFLGMEEISFPRLQPVSLIVGMNGIGKSSVLDALRLHSTCAHPYELTALLRRCGVRMPLCNDDADGRVVADYTPLFHKHDITKPIRIGSGLHDSSDLTLTSIRPDDGGDGIIDRMKSQLEGYDSGKGELLALEIESRGVEQHLPWLRDPGNPYGNRNRLPRVLMKEDHLESLIAGWPRARRRCESMGPGFPDDEKLARYHKDMPMDSVAEQVSNSLHLCDHRKGSRRFTLPNPSKTSDARPAGISVAMKGESFSLPLESLGGGMRRIRGITFALANSHGGMLLLDEPENGLYHGAMGEFWMKILEYIKEYRNIQIIAATHSFEMVHGLAFAMKKIEFEHAAIFRIDRRFEDVIRVVDYDHDGIRIASEETIEFR